MVEDVPNTDRRPSIGGGSTATPLITSGRLAEDIPLTRASRETVRRSRVEIVRVLDGDDDRLLLVVGPCSVHDLDAALVYSRLLAETARAHSEDLLIVMRAYLEKPRTVVGWPGLIADPWLDGGFALEDGLRLGRSLLAEITESGLPVACEWLDPLTPAYLADLVSWGAIGARTVSSQTHRHLASGLPMPIGMKNGIDGAVRPAADAILAAAHSHTRPGISGRGNPVAVTTSGNLHCHVVLRGGRTPNHTPSGVADALAVLRDAGLPDRVVIDASHGNSGKDHLRQRVVAGEIAERVACDEPGVRGVLLESFLEPGRQDAGAGGPLVFGRSVTDACMGWQATEDAFGELAEAVRARRQLSASKSASPVGSVRDHQA